MLSIREVTLRRFSQEVSRQVKANAKPACIHGRLKHRTGSGPSYPIPLDEFGPSRQLLRHITLCGASQSRLKLLITGVSELLRVCHGGTVECIWHVDPPVGDQVS